MDETKIEKREITALDLRFLVKEIREKLRGGMFRKIYQYGGKTKQFLFELFVPTQGGFWLYVDSQKMFITKRKKATPQEPPSFCMFLRKHLMGKKIEDIRQHEFDRIIEIVTKENILIFELLPPGNAILCDTSYNVIMPLQIQKWKDREIRPKQPYKYPVKVNNPFEMDLGSLKRSLARVEKKLIAYVASNLGFGSMYASEICTRAGLDEAKPTTELGNTEILKLHQAIDSMGSERVNPVVYDDFVSPFPLMIYNSKKSQPYESFSDALDEFFSAQAIETVKGEVKKVVEEKKERVERIVQKQDDAIEKWQRIEKDSKDSAERIYNNYTTVEGVINGIQKAKDSGLSWDEIKQRVKSEGTSEAEAIKEIKEHDGLVILDLGGKDVPIDIRKTVEENAQKLYEDAKWARKKYGGAEEAREDSGERLEQAEREVKEQEERDFAKDVFAVDRSEAVSETVSEPTEEEEPETGEDREETLQETGEEPAAQPVQEPVLGVDRPKKKRGKWYHKFKWFHSSQGFLVVAGRNATQNENLIKKRTDNNDFVFHADIPGAAFVVIKSEGHEVPEETKKEAAEFSAANSKAWSRGMGNIDVFSVNPEQISKSPPSGQYLPKGSFMINGERTWYRDMELKLSVGVNVEREERNAWIMAGPVMAVRKNCDYFVTIRPGFKKGMELAKTIKNKILVKARPEDKQFIEAIPIDEIQIVIPSGMGDVVEYVNRDYI